MTPETLKRANAISFRLRRIDQALAHLRDDDTPRTLALRCFFGEDYGYAQTAEVPAVVRRFIASCCDELETEKAVLERELAGL